MKSIFLILFFILVVQVIPAYSQDNADYFPYKKNNYWEYYWVEFGHPDTIVSYSVFDSVDSQGSKIAIFDSHFINPIEPPLMLPDSGTFIIDTNLNVFSNWAPIGYSQYPLIYKLNGKQGDKWIIYDYSHTGNGPFEMARINEVRNDTILRITTKTMRIEYYMAYDSTDTTGLDRWSDILAKGFGLQARGGGDAPASIYLKGAIIDGILYGDTTGMITGVNNQQILPTKFQLYQNYPNPFNPTTKINYQVPKPGNVELKVFDILGREVMMLVNGYKNVGKYTVDFNASKLASGVYIYRLKSGSYISTKKMVILK